MRNKKSHVLESRIRHSKPRTATELESRHHADVSATGLKRRGLQNLQALLLCTTSMDIYLCYITSKHGIVILFSLLYIIYVFQNTSSVFISEKYCTKKELPIVTLYKHITI